MKATKNWHRQIFPTRLLEKMLAWPFECFSEGHPKSAYRFQNRTASQEHPNKGVKGLTAVIVRLCGFCSCGVCSIPIVDVVLAVSIEDAVGCTPRNIEDRVLDGSDVRCHIGAV